MLAVDNQLPEFRISLSFKQKPSERRVIRNSSDIADVARQCFSADQIEWTESFIVIGLSQANKVLGFFKVSSGGMTATVADPKVIMQFALLSCSCNLIIAHNHPSGNLNPSRADEELTRKIYDAAKLFDIKLLDHIIVSSENHYSFCDNGKLY